MDGSWADLLLTLATAIFLLLTAVGVAVASLVVVRSFVANARHHEDLTPWDGHFPLRGRWLRYALAALIALVGARSSAAILYLIYLLPVLTWR